MGVHFGRETGMMLFAEYRAAPTRPLKVVRWSHAAETFQAQKCYANGFPLFDVHTPVATECCFKLYDEVPGTGGLDRDLLIECKMTLTRPLYLGDIYELYLFPLRGTDIWAVIQAASAVLGPPETMIFDDPGLSVYFAAEGA